MRNPGHRWFWGSYPSSVTPGGSPGAGVDGVGAWIDGAIAATDQGVDGTGPWIDTGGTTTAGVDGTGAWVVS